MANYLSYKKFCSIFDEIPKKEFDRLSFFAERDIDALTTGIDGVRKLRDFFPDDSYDAKGVQFAVGDYVSKLYEIEQYQKDQKAVSGYEKTENGYQPRSITSISSGGESVSFSAEKMTDNWISSAAQSVESMAEFLIGLSAKNLFGLKDRNGVNLLYRGRYPSNLLRKKV